MCKLDASAPDEGGEEVDDGFFAVCARTAKSLVEKQYYRTAVNVQHKTLEDFGRMESGARVPSRARGRGFRCGGRARSNTRGQTIKLRDRGPRARTARDRRILSRPDLRRVVVIGSTGAGKSTLLNKLCGYKCAPDANEQFAWDREPLFASSDSVESVTKCAAWAKAHWFGDEERPFVVVDTPGHDDPEAAEVDKAEAREVLSALATDLHEKLKAMREAHVLLVLHSDPYANRLNPATYTILKMLDEKFRDASSSVWKHVVFAYSRCDEESRGWKTNMEPYCGEGKKGKRSEMAATIRAKFGLPANVKDVPVLCLSGVETGPRDSPDFAVLWEAIEDAAPLDTTKIKPFEHVADKIKSLVDERNAAVLLAEAHRTKFAVLLSFAALAAALAWRALLPTFLSRLLLNYSGPEDEVLLFTCLLYFLGPQRVSSAFGLLWADHGRARYRKLEAAALSAFAGAAPKKKNE